MTFWLSRRVLVSAIVLCILGGGLLWGLYNDATARYHSLQSHKIYDRTGDIITVYPNEKGHYTLDSQPLLPEFAALLVEKEDRFFYYHPGINPISSVRGLYNLVRGTGGGGSTITQQLAKNLLGHETKRTIGNKLTELAYALSLELFLSKEEILTWYSNTVYLGNQLQGFPAASEAYFDATLAELTTSEQMALLATISHPTTRNPWESESEAHAMVLSDRLRPQHPFTYPEVQPSYSLQTNAAFELRTAGLTCDSSCIATIDAALTENIRAILARHVENAWQQNARNGAVVVIDPSTAELLALVGSVDPNSNQSGSQINMALAPRPVGSTIKPFIYTVAFERGLRPYSLVDDREYKYPISTGFSLYPKNYDGQYRGVVTLHEALSNSLNVPTVKTLEYIGLEPFYAFLSDRLLFTPIQPYDSYQYGIALGGLEMDLLTLTHYFTTFARGGTIASLQVWNDRRATALPPQSNIVEETRVFAPEHVALTHAVLSDRLRGVNQFGIGGNLEVSAVDYGVKTGTSRDYHDSWVVGYTPDFVVGVWLGNSENEALDQLSGQSGAGAIWHDVMQYLTNTDYYTGERFTFDDGLITNINIDGTLEWGLPGDATSAHQMRLLTDQLVTSPLPEDVFGWTADLSVPLVASEPVTWTVNGEEIAAAVATATFTPPEPGNYEIVAVTPDGDRREIITITVAVTEER